MMLMRSPSSRSVSSRWTSRARASTPECRSETTLTATDSLYPAPRAPYPGAAAHPGGPHSAETGRPKLPSAVVRTRAVLFDYGHTLVDFQRLPSALVAAYGDIRTRLEDLVEQELPQAEELAHKMAEAVDVLITQSYLEGRLQEFDMVELLVDAFASI